MQELAVTADRIDIMLDLSNRLSEPRMLVHLIAGGMTLVAATVVYVMPLFVRLGVDSWTSFGQSGAVMMLATTMVSGLLSMATGMGLAAHRLFRR
jgi:hypothetical protein